MFGKFEFIKDQCLNITNFSHNHKKIVTISLLLVMISNEMSPKFRDGRTSYD